MQNTTQHWKDTNAAPFTTQTNIITIIWREDGTRPIIPRERLLSLKHTASGNMLSAELPRIEVVAKFDNRDGYFTDGDHILTDYRDEAFYQNGKIVFQYGFRKETDPINPDLTGYDMITGATLFIRKFEIGENTVTITANDILSFMTNDISPGATSITAERWIQEIKEQAESDDIVPTDSVQIQYDHDAVDGVFIAFTGQMYRMCDALQLIANACKCVLYVGRGGIIHIEPLKEQMTDYSISKRVQYTNTKIKNSESVNKIAFHYGGGNLAVDVQSATYGRTETITNNALYEPAAAYAESVASWILTTLMNGTRQYSGSFRADPRVDVFDKIKVETTFGEETACLTNISMDYNGAWKGTFEAISVSSITITDIASLEDYTISELENFTLNELEG